MSWDKSQMVLFSLFIGIATALLINFASDCIVILFYGDLDFYTVKRQILGVDLFGFTVAAVLSLWYFLYKNKVKRNVKR